MFRGTVWACGVRTAVARATAGLAFLSFGMVAAPALACPDSGLVGQTFPLTLSDLAQPQVYGVTAGGASRIEGCNLGFGTGYVEARPQITLDLRGSASGVILDLRVEGTCDTVLLVSDPLRRWSFNDDADGMQDPQLMLDAGIPGYYRIWVGTHDPTACASLLTARVIGGQGAPAAFAPPPTPDPETPERGSAPSGTAHYELVIVPEGITFEGARQRAEAMGGHLATIADDVELQAVFAVADDPDAWMLEQGRYFVGPWLGGYREGRVWMWVTGEPWEFTAWAPGQPDNYRGRETHLNMWVRGTSPAPLLNDADPDVPLRGFVVEFPAGVPVGTQPPPSSPGYGFFAEAWYNGERVDGCLYYGRECGQDAADRFCQMMGYIYAVDGAFSTVATSRTLVLGDSRICTIPNGCGQLVNVTCVPSPEAQ